MTFDGGLMLGLKGFCAGVIGGFGNVFGAIVEDLFWGCWKHWEQD
jgi:branched-subunit amino acid ABC-type transport system permease component